MVDVLVLGNRGQACTDLLILQFDFAVLNGVVVQLQGLSEH